jgi:hypothetical protein
MNMLKHTRVVLAALIGFATAGAATMASAESSDYEFQLVDQTVKIGKEAVIAVRLINKKTGKPVPNSVIFASRLDMAPDSMPEMTTKLTSELGAEPGTYRFTANVSMAGGWQLSLGAKVQGETGTVENKLIVKAVK